ncbi:hypothetical protein JOS77_09875 [Chromobacterium haemolyticum]|nr:hypothetical protein JOS77_09875 [Chromobacterium haemolyticum]
MSALPVRARAAQLRRIQLLAMQKRAFALGADVNGFQLRRGLGGQQGLRVSRRQQ